MIANRNVRTPCPECGEQSTISLSHPPDFSYQHTSEIQWTITVTVYLYCYNCKAPYTLNITESATGPARACVAPGGKILDLHEWLDEAARELALKRLSE